MGHNDYGASVYHRTLVLSGRKMDYGASRCANVAALWLLVAFGGGGSLARRDGKKNGSKLSNSDSARRAVNFAPKISSGGRF